MKNLKSKEFICLTTIKESSTYKSDKDKSDSDIVTLMEKEWSEMTAEFKKLQREQYELFCHKQHDYGPPKVIFQLALC